MYYYCFLMTYVEQNNEGGAEMKKEQVENEGKSISHWITEEVLATFSHLCSYR